MGVPRWAVGIEGRSATKHLLHSSPCWRDECVLYGLYFVTAVSRF